MIFYFEPLISKFVSLSSVIDTYEVLIYVKKVLKKWKISFSSNVIVEILSDYFYVEVIGKFISLSPV